MRKLIISAAAVVLACGLASAQVPVPGEGTAVHVADSIPEGYELVDTVVYIRAAVMDSTLAGKNIFTVMPLKILGAPADVRVHQSLAISTAMNRHFFENSSKPVEGYRVRIFFDNRQSARHDSEQMVEAFEKLYPGVPAYRSYVNPYFKITVGDFRTKSEAMSFLRRIIGEFPKAFIVKENIEYPVLDKDSLFRADTVRFLRKLAGDEVPAEEEVVAL